MTRSLGLGRSVARWPGHGGTQAGSPSPTRICEPAWRQWLRGRGRVWAMCLSPTRSLSPLQLTAAWTVTSGTAASESDSAAADLICLVMANKWHDSVRTPESTGLMTALLISHNRNLHVGTHPTTLSQEVGGNLEDWNLATPKFINEFMEQMKSYMKWSYNIIVCNDQFTVCTKSYLKWIHELMRRWIHVYEFRTWSVWIQI